MCTQKATMPVGTTALFWHWLFCYKFLPAHYCCLAWQRRSSLSFYRPLQNWIFWIAQFLDGQFILHDITMPNTFECWCTMHWLGSSIKQLAINGVYWSAQAFWAQTSSTNYRQALRWKKTSKPPTDVSALAGKSVFKSVTEPWRSFIIFVLMIVPRLLAMSISHQHGNSQKGLHCYRSVF